jgi:ATP-dependent helicase HrpB
MLLRAAEGGWRLAKTACTLAALLEERDLLRKPLGGGGIVGGPGADVRLRLSALQGSLLSGCAELGGWEVDAGVARRVGEAAQLLLQQLRACLAEEGAPEPSAQPPPLLEPDSPHAAGLLLALAYPDRVGRVRQGKPGTFALAGGGQAALSGRVDEEPLCAVPWLAAAEVDGAGGAAASPRIRTAAPLPPDAPAHPWLAEALRVEEIAFWNPSSGSCAQRRVSRLGQLLLSETVLPAPTGARLRDALMSGIREHLGLWGALKLSAAGRGWRDRVSFLSTFAPAAAAAAGVEPLPDLSDAALLAGLESWLGPWLDGVSTKGGLQAVDAEAALRSLLTHQQQRFVETSAPTHFAAPSGSRLPIDYAAAHSNGGCPALEVRLQEMFGFTRSPTVAGVPLLLCLLSPASREVARTSDLASFWTSPGGYPAVRKDLRGRYPKHSWPEKPLEATPTSKRKQAGT